MDEDMFSSFYFTPSFCVCLPATDGNVRTNEEILIVPVMAYFVFVTTAGRIQLLAFVLLDWKNMDFENGDSLCSRAQLLYV